MTGFITGPVLEEEEEAEVYENSSAGTSVHDPLHLLHKMLVLTADLVGSLDRISYTIIDSGNLLILSSSPPPILFDQIQP
ncbi:hypothetical protein Scep_016344 [Stephania cephalantha]|uniref:Uncharacterized protein n=1 Tax=Stephania cephalantha TaxID=152367 RepID=A0AAP0IMH6_9MAGN